MIGVAFWQHAPLVLVNQPNPGVWDGFSSRIQHPTGDFSHWHHLDFQVHRLASVRGNKQLRHWRRGLGRVPSRLGRFVNNAFSSNTPLLLAPQKPAGEVPMHKRRNRVDGEVVLDGRSIFVGCSLPSLGFASDLTPAEGFTRPRRPAALFALTATIIFGCCGLFLISRPSLAGRQHTGASVARVAVGRFCAMPRFSTTGEA
jgi:hypothetical protein